MKEQLNSLQLSTDSCNQSNDSKQKTKRFKSMSKKTSNKRLNQKTIKEENLETNGETKSNVCSFIGCQKEFKSRKNLHNHRLVHTRPKTVSVPLR